MQLSIDLGSSLCKAIIGKKNQENSLEILGVGVSPNYGGIKLGSIINIDQSIQSIQEAMEEACLQAGATFDSVTINVTGKTVVGENSRGVVAISNKNRIVGEDDIYRVIEGAKNVRIPIEQEIIHILSRSYTLDNQESIKNPLGMTGIRLEAEVHLVSAGITAINNIRKVTAACGLYCNAIVMSSLASANALLSEEEKELGLCLIDIGNANSDIIVYRDGGIAYSSSIPYAGQHVTHDLSIGLKIPLATAEMTKKTYGAASNQSVDPLEKIELPQIGGRDAREVPRQYVVEIIQARLEEIFDLIERELVKSSEKKSLAGGIILCGGTALTEGIADLCEEKLGLATSVRAPENVTGFSEQVNSPEFATGVGLLHYAYELAKSGMPNNRHNRTPMLNRLKKWFYETI